MSAFHRRLFVGGGGHVLVQERKIETEDELDDWMQNPGMKVLVHALFLYTLVLINSYRLAS